MIARATALLAFLILAVPVAAQTPAKPAAAPEAALAAVAKHMSPPYALYLYESLTAQILYNENIRERPNSPNALLADDSLWALGIVSKSILVDGPDGQYLDVRLVPAFFEDIAHRYMNAAHYWPDRDVTPENRREHMSAWYSLYLMLLVGNEMQDVIARKLKGGAFERDPGMLTPGGPPLVDKLKMDKVLTNDAQALVRIQRKGPEGQESLTFPDYMDRWQAKIRKAYEATPAP